MKHALAILLILLLLLAAVAGCGDAAMQPTVEEETTQEEPQTTVYEWPTSSYAQLESEVERLGQFLVDHNIRYWGAPHPIDIAYQKELKENNYHARGLTSLYAEKWQEEMEKCLGLLAEVLTEEHKKMLDANQKEWEAYIVGKNNLEFSVILRASGGGTMMNDIAAGNYYDKYRDRTLFLEMLYNNAQDESYRIGPWDYEE